MDDLFGCTLNAHCYLVNKTRTPCGKILCPLEDEAAEENPLTPELTCGECKNFGFLCHLNGHEEKTTTACVKIVLSEEASE